METKDNKPIELHTIASLLQTMPHDMSGYVCGFDIDGTIIGLDPEDTKKKVVPEKDTIDTMKELIVRGAKVIIITARQYSTGQYTKKELETMGFSFVVNNKPYFATQETPHENGHMFYCNILHPGKTASKGEALKLLLETNNVRPTCIVHVDDSNRECEGMLSAFAKDTTTQVVVYRYMKCNESRLDY